MIVKSLVENTSISGELGSEHGLSLYIETGDHKLLFDVGASELFLKNAERLGVDIADVDFLVISHGHYDHGGGLKTFLNENTKAEVFVHNLAFQKYYAERQGNRLEYIGLEGVLKKNRRLVLTSDRFFISKGIQLFSNVLQREALPRANKGLMMEQNGEMVKDVFAHEQNLIIEEDGSNLLVTGCAHNGIVNIIKHFHDIKGFMPDIVIGGFHLSSRSPDAGESDEAIDNISRVLMDTKAKYYTCHCTGMEPYKMLRSTMTDNIDYLSSGSAIEI